MNRRTSRSQPSTRSDRASSNSSVPGPCRARRAGARQPGIGLPVGVEGQGLEEVEPEGRAALSRPSSTQSQARSPRRRAEDQPAEEVAVERVQVEAGQLGPGRTRRRASEAASSVSSIASISPAKKPGPSVCGGWSWSSSALDELEGLGVHGEEAGAGTTPASAPWRRSACGGPSAASSCPCSGLQEPAPGLQPDLLARVARPEQVGGQPADGGVVVVGQADQLVDGQVAGVGAGVLGGVGAGRRPRASRTAGAPPRAGRASRKAACSNRGTLSRIQTTNSSTGSAADADQSGHPGRLDLAERGAEVGLQRLGGELPDPVAAGPLQQAEQRPRGSAARGRRTPGASAGSGRPMRLKWKSDPVVLAGLVEEDVVGDPGPSASRCPRRSGPGRRRRRRRKRRARPRPSAGGSARRGGAR